MQHCLFLFVLQCVIHTYSHSTLLVTKPETAQQQFPLISITPASTADKDVSFCICADNVEYRAPL